MSSVQARPAAAHPGTRWATLASFVLATFYLWLLLWLGAFVVVPSLGLGWDPVVVTSGSMQPRIRPGDVVLLERGDTSDLGLGSVVTFEDPAAPGTLTTHRISGVNPDGTYRTRGDANRVADSTPVQPEAVKGVGKLLVPFVGLPVTWLAGAAGLFVLWLLVTTVACAVALTPPEGEDDRSDPDGTTGHGRTPAPGRIRRVAGAVHWSVVIVPQAAANRLVLAGFRGLRRAAATLADAVPARPAASTVRAWALPVALVTLALTAAAPALRVTAWTAVVGVLALDPRGPELRTGRWLRRLRRLRARLPSPNGRPLPSVVLRPAMALAMILASLALVGERTSAAFGGASDNAGNSFETAASFCSADPQTVTASADTYVDESAPASTHGSEADLFVRSEDGGARRTYVTFALPSEPTHCTLAGATLRLHTTQEGSRTVETARVDGAWDETTLTWSSQPGSAAAAATAATTDGVTDWLEWDVTSVADDWYAGTATNHGLVVQDADETAATAITQTIVSSDAGGNVPELVLEWE